MENTSANRKTTRDYKEMLLLKGIGSELEKMAYPKVANLRAMLETMGYTVVPYTYSKPVESPSDEDMELKSSYKY
jgi:hypothetical protein